MAYGISRNNLQKVQVSGKCGSLVRVCCGCKGWGGAGQGFLLSLLIWAVGATSLTAGMFKYHHCCCQGSL